MHRRAFLSALLGAAVLDPERALWVPGAKVISIPAPVQPYGLAFFTTSNLLSVDSVLNVRALEMALAEWELHTWNRLGALYRETSQNLQGADSLSDFARKSAFYAGLSHSPPHV